MWLPDRPKWDQPHYNKLKRIWQGPYEVIRWEGGDRYVIQVGETQKVVASGRLKFYRFMLEKVTAPFSYFSDRQLPPNDDTHIGTNVQDIPHGFMSYLQTCKHKLCFQITHKFFNLPLSFTHSRATYILRHYTSQPASVGYGRMYTLHSQKQ